MKHMVKAQLMELCAKQAIQIHDQRAEISRLNTQLEAERTVGRSNARAASKHETLKAEFIRRHNAGENVVISGGVVQTLVELRATQQAARGVH